MRSPFLRVDQTFLGVSKFLGKSYIGWAIHASFRNGPFSCRGGLSRFQNLQDKHVIGFWDVNALPPNEQLELSNFILISPFFTIFVKNSLICIFNKTTKLTVSSGIYVIFVTSVSCFVDRCLYFFFWPLFRLFFFDIGFWLPLWYLQTLLKTFRQFEVLHPLFIVTARSS